MRFSSPSIAAQSIRRSQLAHSWQGASNTGAPVTVTAVNTVIASITVAGVEVGDLLLVPYNVFLTKGATAGITTVIVRNTGTATVHWSDSGGDSGDDAAHNMPSHPAASVWSSSGCVIGEVTAAGTVVIELAANSSGSNSTVTINNGHVGVLRLHP